MKYLVTLAFPDSDSRDRFYRILGNLLGGLPGLRSIACSLRRFAEKAEIKKEDQP